MVDAAVPLIDIIWRDLTARFNLRDPDQRAALSAEIKRLLATIKNSDVREAYATALRELYRGGGSRSNAAGGGMRCSWQCGPRGRGGARPGPGRSSRGDRRRSEEHTSELQSLMRLSYDVFCMTKKQDKY